MVQYPSHGLPMQTLGTNKRYEYAFKISKHNSALIFEVIQSYELLQSLTEMYNTKLHIVLELSSGS